MNFNKHYALIGQHALLSPSKHYWINYDHDKLCDFFYSSKAKERGTELHAFAAKCIELKQKLPKSKKTLNMYVNDAIGFRMQPEQILYYSENCFGTVDTICFNNKLLRIHDLKTGSTPAHIEQLELYAALFCLEYHVDPKHIHFELRIYQSDDILVEEPDSDLIQERCNQIIFCDRAIKELNTMEE